MILNTVFLSNVIQKHCSDDIYACITDCTAIVLSSGDQQLIGSQNATARYILHAGQSAIIDDEVTSESCTFGSPITLQDEVLGTVITWGERNHAINCGNMIKAAVEAALEYNSFSQSVLSLSDERTLVARELIENSFTRAKILSRMNRLELDAELFRSVICISLVYHNPRYFNINLNLGYQSSIEKVNDEILKRIRNCRFFNSQDLTLAYDQNTIIIMKSFIQKSDIPRAYLCLDEIIKDVITILNNFNSFSFHAAYGNIYPGISDIHKSYTEAREIISIGLKTFPEDDFYTIEKLLFFDVCNSLHPQIVNKLILSSINLLKGDREHIPLDIIKTAEAFVDNCMNVSKTSAAIFMHRNTICSRLNILKERTGLDPVHNFADAFIIKMMAAHLSYSESTSDQ